MARTIKAAFLTPGQIIRFSGAACTVLQVHRKQNSLCFQNTWLLLSIGGRTFQHSCNAYTRFQLV